MSLQIYLIRNVVNGKIYIGQTSCGYQNRFKQHLKEAKKNSDLMLLTKAIHKYGLENFTCELIDESATSRKELDDLEIRYIKQYNSLVPNGYNVSVGGGSVNLPREEASARHHNRLRSGKNSFIGVIERDGSFRAKLNFLRKQIHIGTFASAEEAAKARDIKSLEVHGQRAMLNFPELLEEYRNGNVKPVTAQEVKEKNRPKTIINPRTPPPLDAPYSYRAHTLSRYRGVTFHNGKWLAQICINRKAKCIGYFRTEEEAARAYDKKRFELFGSKERLNFPQEI